MGVIAGMLFLTCPQSALGDRGRLEVFDLLPASVDHARAARILDKKARWDIQLVPLDASLVAFLQWAGPDPARNACLAQAEALIADIDARGRVPPPESASGLFDALVAQAEQQLLYVDFQGVLESVAQARSALPCTDRIVPKAQLRSLYLHEAVAYLYQGDPRAQDAFVQMLVVDPRVYLEPEHPPRVRKAFLEAAERFMALDPRPLDAGGLPGDAYVDGLPVENVNELRPGRHLVQLEGPGGQVRSVLIEVPEAPGPVKLADLVDVGLPGPAKVRALLLTALRAGQLDQHLAGALDAYLQSVGNAQAVFALYHHGLSVAVYQAGAGLVDPESEAYARYFRSPPPWRGLAPSVEGNMVALVEGTEVSTSAGGQTWSATLRMGAGGALGGPSAWGGFVELDVTRRFMDLWYPGLFGQFVYQTLDAGVSYPQARFGAVVAMKLPLGDHLAFWPAIGYGVGKGPPVDGSCRVVSQGDTEVLSCESGSLDTGAASDSSDILEAILATRSHGPLLRIELAFGGRVGSLAWTAGVGLQGDYEFLSIHDGEMADGEVVRSYEVETSHAGGVAVVDAVASFRLAF